MSKATIQPKNILITGANSGLGKATAIFLAQQGHHVFAAMRNTKGSNASAVDELLTLKHNHQLQLDIIDMNVTEQESVDAAVQQILKASHIDVLINNVGIMNVGITEAYDVEELKELFDINVFSMARTTQAVLPHMRERKQGLLIHISSLAGRVVFPFFGSYCASKFAFEALAETYHYELKKFGIDSIIVEPGPHRTKLIDTTPKPKGNTSVLTDYQDHIELSENILNTFKNFQEKNDASDPNGVAEAISNLIESNGKRPLRTVVGTDFGVREINETLEPLQKKFMQGLHLDDMI
ncbi:SDR family oxidoreductase [Aliikangiella sp. IMCC44359]|uniref:SDR family oxidoreductase n=1 Tax=Aliikangiella sp. IMCC44359 TaxID=3459125 RepID=UPI00403A870D